MELLPLFFDAHTYVFIYIFCYFIIRLVFIIISILSFLSTFFTSHISFILIYAELALSHSIYSLIILMAFLLLFVYFQIIDIGFFNDVLMMLSFYFLLFSSMKYAYYNVCYINQ